MALRFIDIGANLTDPMFQGQYGNSCKHQPDLDIVLERAWDNGLERIIVTVGSLNEVESASKLAREDDRIFYTIGCHPTRCDEFLRNPDEYFNNLCKKVEENPRKVVAIGECGLDYDRLQFCEKNVQKLFFEKQLALASKYKLPLFLHCRNAHNDFMEIIEKSKDQIDLCGGVVHSFDGTADEAQRVIDNGFFIGLNGCSLKTEDNLNVVREIPNDRIMLESDSPWCGVRPSHAGFKFIQTHFPTVKKKEKWTAEKLIDSRNEPCKIIQNMEIIAAVKNEPLGNLANMFYENSCKVFFSNTILSLKYGALLKDNTMIKVNFIGLVINIVFIQVFYAYTSNEHRPDIWRKSVMAGLFIYGCFIYAKYENPDLIEFRFGMLITTILVVLVGSPLLQLKEIVKKKNTENLPFPIIVAGTVVALSWMLYGISIKNSGLVYQNGLLLFLSSIQLGLIAICPRKPLDVRKTSVKSSHTRRELPIKED